jgi:four helix bundle protein
MKTHRDLNVWKNSINLIVDVYQITRQFPKEEKYGLTDQIRRAAVSVSANISEGAGRKSKAEFTRFLTYSCGSLSELETLLIVGRELGYFDNQTWMDLFGKIKLITTQLYGLIRSLRA